MERRKFIKNCMYGCAGALCAYFAYKVQFINSKNKEITSYIDNDEFWNKEPFIELIEVDLAQHCNLNCKYCNNFSCIAEKEFYDFEKYKKDLSQLAKVTKKRIKVFYLLGGGTSLKSSNQ